MPSSLMTRQQNVVAVVTLLEEQSRMIKFLKESYEKLAGDVSRIADSNAFKSLIMWILVKRRSMVIERKEREVMPMWRASWWISALAPLPKPKMHHQVQFLVLVVRLELSIIT